MNTTNNKVRDAALGVRRRKRAALYLRVSTPSQVNTDFNPEGISIPAQRDAGTRKGESLNADIVNEFIEPGKTATSIDKRPKFQELLAWVKEQKDIDYVIVYHFNRIFRNSIDAAITKKERDWSGGRVGVASWSALRLGGSWWLCPTNRSPRMRSWRRWWSSCKVRWTQRWRGSSIWKRS